MIGINKDRITPLPHWRKLMGKAGWETIQEMALACNIPYEILYPILHGDRKNLTGYMLNKIAQSAHINIAVLAEDILKYEKQLAS